MKDKAETNEQISCPFCGEQGFDLLGFKTHLLAFCVKFDELGSD